MSKMKRDTADDDLEDIGNVAKKQSMDPDEEFNWNMHCMICGNPEDKKHNKPFSLVNMNPVDVREHVLQAAKKRHDSVVYGRLCSDTDLFEVNARYHRKCYQSYISARNIEVATRKAMKHNLHTPLTIATQVLNDIDDDLKNGKVFSLPELCQLYRLKLLVSGVSDNEINAKSNFVKSKFIEAGGKTVSFYSQKGKCDVMCSSSFPIAKLLMDTHNENQTSSETAYSSVKQRTQVEDSLILTHAAEILRASMRDIPSTVEYPTPKEVLSSYSQELVPKNLLTFVNCLLHLDVPIDEVPIIQETLEVSKRRTLAICETLIFSARRKKKNQVLPPLQVGLMIELAHEHASKRLIDTLHSYGFCGSYGEFRAFVTSAANDELTKTIPEYVPSGIIHRELGGSLIQEGNDNIDINVETIDGKGTYHSMARVIFQEQDPKEDTGFVRIQRSNSKTLVPKHDLPQFRPFTFLKPKEKAKPLPFDNAFLNIERLQASVDLNFKVEDLGWILLRIVSRGYFETPKAEAKQCIPMWTGFNTQVGDIKTRITVPSYAPSIDERPSDMSTVYTVLKRGQSLAQLCGQTFHIHTFDQQLYAVAQQVKFCSLDEFPSLVVRLGGFHTLCTFLACIGKIWGDGGLKDMLVDSGIYASNTVDQILVGKQFHRAIRALTLCYEALMQLLLENMQAWLSDGDVPLFNELLDKVLEVHTKYTGDSFSADVVSELNKQIEEVLPALLNNFRKEGRKSATFIYWDECIRALQIMLLFIRADREGDWDSHLASQANMLPFFFACDRPNYARWATLYVLEMVQRLPIEVQEEFRAGKFSVKFTSGAFRGLWTDMAVEMSVVKDTKGDTGIVGFTRKESAVLRWTLTRHIMGAYSRAMRFRSGENDDPDNESGSSFVHEQQGATALKRDDTHVQALVEHMKENMADPFQLQTDKREILINIGSGVVADQAIHDSLLATHKIGMNSLRTFVSTRLDSKQITTSFYSPVKRNNLKTFADTKKKTKIKMNGVISQVVISPEKLFQRALAVSQSRPELNLQVLLSYPITSVPSSLFKPDGARRPATKSQMLHGLEHEVSSEVMRERPVNNDSVKVIVIVDAMAELQKLNTKGMKTFDDVGQHVLKKVTSRLNTSDEVHYVFDRYDDGPLYPKADERSCRYGSFCRKYDISAGRPIPDWKSVLSSDYNKMELTRFLCEYMDANFPQILPGKKLVVAGGYKEREEAKIVNASGTYKSSFYSCNHSEADTRIIFHMVQCTKGNAKKTLTFFVESPDTDVLVLLTSHYNHTIGNPRVWFQTGSVTNTQDLTRFIPVHSLVNKLTPTLCTSLLAVHALTGCDTVSSFFGIGKRKPLTVAKTMDEQDQKKLVHISDTASSLDDRIVSARKLVALLYDTNKKFVSEHVSLNALRSKLALSKMPSLDRLPPSEIAFKEHVRRASWQGQVWSSAHIANMSVPSPEDWGWFAEKDVLAPVFFQGPTSMEVLESFLCNCKGKSPCAKNCACRSSSVECCDICSCSSSCKNNKCTEDEPEAP